MFPYLNLPIILYIRIRYNSLRQNERALHHPLGFPGRAESVGESEGGLALGAFFDCVGDGLLLLGRQLSSCRKGDLPGPFEHESIRHPLDS